MTDAADDIIVLLDPLQCATAVAQIALTIGALSVALRESGAIDPAALSEIAGNLEQKAPGDGARYVATLIREVIDAPPGKPPRGFTLLQGGKAKEE